MSAEPLAWWASLKHGGLLIAPSRLEKHFAGAIEPLPFWLDERLRRDLGRLDTDAADAARAFQETVLEKICLLDHKGGGMWTSGNNVPARWSFRSLTGEIVKPRRIWNGPNDAFLPVFVDDEKRIGIGRGRRSFARVVEWLRASGQKLALLTNNYQWRLIYAGLDHEAWVEWDTELWFQEGHPSLQIDALRILLAPEALTPPEEVGAKPGAEVKSPPLLAAIQETRRGQAELSAALGERVRESVELLIQSHAPVLGPLQETVPSHELYRAATRIIMRMVVGLFAEARDLLPRYDALYHGSYGLQGLREQLERVSGDRLRNRFGAWPRVLALFRLIYDGSHHERLTIPRYGGGLFQPGDPNADDLIRRAIHVFETGCFDSQYQIMPDALVYEILQLLCFTTVAIRQGTAMKPALVPVDFSDLSSEYIGILYEGLLDYELKRAAANDPVVFLNVGDQPALPLSRLESLNDKALADLVEKLKQKKKVAVGGDDDGDADEDESSDEEDESDENEETLYATDSADIGALVVSESAAEYGEDTSKRDARHDAEKQALDWCRKAVIAGGLVSKPRSKKPDALQKYEADVNAECERLISPDGKRKIVLPGEWYLVRWGGTRKGAGTFYTRPALAVPTVHRTLRPLVYDPPKGADGQPNEDAPAADWKPKSPDAILALKICDPACGSGSFPVAALRFLSDALFRSLFDYGWVVREKEALRAPGIESRPAWFQELLSGMPDEADEAEKRIRARLKRYVVERCIYGVDLDPLAVELARLALWIETMDKYLPFEFLDHKIKPGNALVGCWFDRFRDYPIMAWKREGGDKKRARTVHFPSDAWTKAISKRAGGEVKEAVADWIRGQAGLMERIGGRTPEELRQEAEALFEQLHAMPLQKQEERARFYQEQIVGSVALAALKESFDAWCALWFWPAEHLDHAPLPANFGNLPTETRALLAKLVQQHRFFHWELEFPDVFTLAATQEGKAAYGGFDAMIGNPPWEIQKPNSKEFFSEHDPLYRTYGKQEAIEKQLDYFQQDIETERAWLHYCARFKALSHWNKNAAFPFGDVEDDSESNYSFSRSSGASAALHALWRDKRQKRGGYADPEHPFRHQGSADINTYKMFLEESHALLKYGGRFGLIVPSGIYTDKGSTDLRTLFLSRCRWHWLFGFENRHKIFDIDSRFKFCPLIVEKGGSTVAIRTAFMRHEVKDWEDAEKLAVPHTAEQVARFSPKSKVILELKGETEYAIFEKVYSQFAKLSDYAADESNRGVPIRYIHHEFFMTADSKLFSPKSWWQEHGYSDSGYGYWIGPNADRAYAIVEGRMIDAFDFSGKGWISGKGRTAKWRDIQWGDKVIEPQFLIAEESYRSKPEAYTGWKLTLMDVTSATNERTIISCPTRESATVDSCRNLVVANGKLDKTFIVGSIFNSFSFDFFARLRVGGLHVTWFQIEEMVVPPLDHPLLRFLIDPSRRLCTCHVKYSADWLRAKGQNQVFGGRPWKSNWAISTAERLRLRCIIDALVAESYTLEPTELTWILADCDYALSRLHEKAFRKTLDPKGFWRIDQDKDPELRHTVLTLAAFRDLKAMIESHGGDREKGIEAFCNQNDGEGWMLPETLCLADLGLGHDERAKTPQPVRARLGERFLPWQLEQSVEDSWKECELHARNLLGESGFARLQAELRGEIVPDEEPVPPAQPAVATENGEDFALVPGAPLKKKGRKPKDPAGQNHMF